MVVALLARMFCAVASPLDVPAHAGMIKTPLTCGEGEIIKSNACKVVNRFLCLFAYFSLDKAPFLFGVIVRIISL